MNWEKSDHIAATSWDKDHALVVYGTSSVAGKIPVNELLTADELAYSGRVNNAVQKSTWLSCRATLRLVLGAELGLKPAKIEFRKNRFGKPYLSGTNLFFNVSHCGPAFLLGFNLNGRIGIDIELLNGSENLRLLANYAFSADEIQYCQNGENSSRFTEIWTLKEAYLKALGIGLVNHLPTIRAGGTRQNDLVRNHLNHKSFSCPNGESGSIVFTNKQKIQFIQMN